MKFFTYAALVFGVSAINLNQMTTDEAVAQLEEDTELQLTYPTLAEVEDDFVEVDEEEDSGDEGDEEEEAIKKEVEAFIEKNGSITLKDIRKIIKPKLKAHFKAALKEVMKEVKKAFKACDADKDKKVTAAEFKACMAKAAE